jgi:AbiV family abortive infection protein
MRENKDEFYLELIQKCVKNAKQFYLDALELKKIKSYGHAYALAVLGFEELGKAWGIAFLQIGIYQEDDKIIKELFKDHIIKHFAGWEILSMFFIESWEDFVLNSKYKERYENLSTLDINGKPQPEVYKKQLWDLVLDMSSDDDKEISKAANKYINLKEILDDLSENNRLLNNRKLLGLYVDVDFENSIIKKNIIYEPEAFGEDNLGMIDTLETFLNISETVLNIYKDNINNPKFIRFKEFVIKIMEKARELDERND